MATAQETLQAHWQDLMAARDNARRLRDECNAKRRELRAAEVAYQQLRFETATLVMRADEEKKLEQHDGNCVG